MEKVMQQLTQLTPTDPISQERTGLSYKEELLTEPRIQELLTQHAELLAPLENQYYLSDWVEYLNRVDACSGCLTYDDCKQPIKGYRPVLQPSNQQLTLTHHKCENNVRHQQLANLMSFYHETDFKHCELTSFELTEKRAEQCIPVFDFCEARIKDKETRGVYVHGAFGVGKTYLLAAVANRLCKHNITCGIVYVPSLVEDLKSRFDNPSKGSVYDILEQFKTIEVLILDDIGAESVTPWVRDEVLGTILNHRMMKGLTTCFSSNLNWNQLEKQYGYTNKGGYEELKAARLMERIKALSNEIQLKGKSYRSYGQSGGDAVTEYQD